MNKAELQLRTVGDPRLAAHATSPFPAWLWSIDGTRVLWANAAAAQVFDAANPATLAGKIFGPADRHRRQVAQLAHRLPPGGTVRLERLRGFGASLGMLMTCGCARLEFADGEAGVLIVATEPAGRAMPLVERLQRLVAGLEAPLAAFAPDGMFVGASDAARPLLGSLDLTGADFNQARRQALEDGRAEIKLAVAHVTLQRLGSGVDTALVAAIAAGAAQAGPAGEKFAGERDDGAPPETAAADQAAQNVTAPGDMPMAEYERPAMSGEAPAEFALIDEFEASLETEAVEPPETRHDLAAAATPGATDACSHRPPLKLSWQMDAAGRFSLGPDEFSRLIGARAAAGFGRPWNEIASTLGLDSKGDIEKAIAARTPFGGVMVDWPADGGLRLRTELSGAPIFDGAQNYLGYRGLGVCRDVDALAHLEAMRRRDFADLPPAPAPGSNAASNTASVSSSGSVPPGSLAAEIAKLLPAADLPSGSGEVGPAAGAGSPPAAAASSPQTDLGRPVETQDEAPDEPPRNVVPFRPAGEARTPVLTPVENSAFNELARQLSARLEVENGAPATASPFDAAGEGPVAAEFPHRKAEPPNWLTRAEPPARGESPRDRMLLDLLPNGILIYRLDRLLYANPAFLDRTGYASLHALEQAGGLDALYVEPGVSSASSTSQTGTPVTITIHQDSAHAKAAAIDATLHTISWDEESAHALIFSAVPAGDALVASPAQPLPEPSEAGHANAEELGAILDTAADAIVMFDAEGNLNSCNRSAEALFGYDGAELVRRNLALLCAPESQGAVMDYLARLKGEGLASVTEHGREVLARARSGALIPLSMTMGRTRPDGPNFFAVFRDLSQARRSESELREARLLAERAAGAKADLLARISHEIRAPLNAIIGFAELMIGERFGPLGNERYVEYMKDIRASGERVVAIIDNLADLSRVETGRLDLSLDSQDLNGLVESCVSALQPQANRERIIIRTSLAHMLPPVVADGRILRQIALNLIGNSIHLARTGGQVIVSTALTDLGDVVLRVRDTGNGLNDDEVAAAMEPFRTLGPSDQTAEGSPVSLSLTRALVEANRAQFRIRTGARSGTLVEVVFSTAAMEKT
jgi:PAS domain S-box-containing protein